ncbi:MAG: CBS domain-containing protein [Deltaproteobacteria bacterium]|nr:CBS domain-containing protein [Deltaproteobacteria bacterium]
MLVKGWMVTEVITVDEDTSMMKASIIMKEKKIRCLPVVNKKGDLVGIVSDRDLRDAAPSKATTLDVYELNYLLSSIKIKDLMTKNLVCARPDKTIEFAAILMLENKISSLPVVNNKNKLVGIITQTDIFKVLVNITVISILSTRETAEEGRRNVYIRGSALPDQKLRDLVEELEGKFVVLYTSKDLLDEVENRRVRIA